MSALFQQKANRYMKEMPEIFWRTSQHEQESLQDFSSAVWFWRTSPTSRPPSGYYYRFRKPIEWISLSIFKTGVQQKQESLQDFHYRFRKPIERIIGGLIQQKIIQESFTRNDIYKSHEIIHFNAILQRAPRHHHSNIHTSITYTPVSYTHLTLPTNLRV